MFFDLLDASVGQEGRVRPERLRAVEDALMAQAIPYRIYGGLKFYDRKEIKDILAYLKLVVNEREQVRDVLIDRGCGYNRNNTLFIGDLL